MIAVDSAEVIAAAENSLVVSEAPAESEAEMQLFVLISLLAIEDAAISV